MTDHTPPTDTQLDDIAARAAALYEYGAEACGPDVDQLADTDVPKLLAEVRRLRAVPAALPSIHANDVEGFCPACGHGVLMLGDGGHVVCTLMDCPRPEAADELLRNAAVPSAPAGRAGLRDRIAEALYAHSHPGWATRYTDLDRDERETYLARADAVLAKLPPPVDRAAVLREASVAVAALDRRKTVIQADTIRDAWEEGRDEGADLLRRMADEAEHEEPVRCPLCTDARALDTPTEAREHFTTVHPEERLVGSGPWPLLANRADEAQPFTVQVWPLARVLAEVRCGSQDWTWDEEWADLDHRHAATGYLNKLEQQIQANGITMPVLIGTDGRLWDGHHRLRIAVRLGIDYVPVEVPAVVESGKEA